MSEHSADRTRELVDSVYRAESRRILATLIRLLGDFELAEDALHDAFAAAMERWPKEGVPANPRAWLVSAGRFKGIDVLRRRGRFDAAQNAIAGELGAESAEPAVWHDEGLEDDRLRLIFTCCHPALASDARTRIASVRDGLRSILKLLSSAPGTVVVVDDYRLESPPAPSLVKGARRSMAARQKASVASTHVVARKPVRPAKRHKRATARSNVQNSGCSAAW